MSHKKNVPPFSPVFGAMNPVLVEKPKNVQEFIANAERVMKMAGTTPLEYQVLYSAVVKAKSGRLALGDWPCIAIFLEIAKLAQNLDPLD